VKDGIFVESLVVDGETDENPSDADGGRAVLKIPQSICFFFHGRDVAIVIKLILM
jgi:hypothetical protein